VSATRLLYLFHRWAGIVLCLILALWFFSGFFMMYVDFPQLSRPERLLGTAPLDAAAVRLSPIEAASRLTPADFRIAGTPSRNMELPEEQPGSLAFRGVALSSYLGHPAYTLTPDNGAQPRAVLADTGEVVRDVDAKRAIEAAADFAVRAGLIRLEETARLRHLSVVQTDQWSVSSALDPHRPLHVIALGDERNTELYVSSTTGQVVRDTNARERVLNYFGAVTHWIYPTVLRQYPDAWEWVVDILAAVAAIMAFAGLWIAVRRWRFRRRAGQSRIPYRGLMRWHYITGAIFGVIVATWAFSGLLSLNPAQLNPSRSPTDTQRQLFRGTPLPLDAYPAPAAENLPGDVRELTITQYRGQPLWLATTGDGRKQLTPADPAAGFERPDVITLANLAPELMPGVPVLRQHLLTEYDDYYYSRHPQTGEKPLPVLRIEFSDAAHTWFHIDPATGQLLERSTTTNRIFRWLYNGLHSFDFRWLWERRPLWDIVVILLCGGGFTLSVIGVIAGIRRLKFDLARSRALRRQAAGDVPKAVRN
jgi:hypothetical protein